MTAFANVICVPNLRRAAGTLRYVLSLFAIGLSGVLPAQTLTNLGAVAPSPGANDISQLSTSGNTTWPDGINYFTDNNPPVGQKFTTGTNAMKLVSLAIKTAGLNSGGSYGTPANTPTYYLSIYSISNSTATLLITFSAANPGFTDGNWLKWSGLNVLLATNKTYAFTFGRQPSSGGYAALAVAANAYAGGEIVTIPITGGPVVTGGSHSFDAVFDIGLQPAAITNIPASTPWPSPTYGMNVGNELELNWGPPNTALFYSAVQNGFNAARIPCAWDMAGATTNISGGVTNYVISPSYMAQVKQTVDAAIAAGMYVMINDHWDDGWLEQNIGTTVDPVINAKVKAYWTQIATTFAGYDNHLLFAAANEPNVGSPAAMNTLMFYYQTFVNAVRAVGGNNTNRWLVLQGGGDTTWLNSLPTDMVTNRLMMEYHCYSPFQFTQLQGDASWGPMQYFWGPAYHYSGDASHNCGSPEEGAIDAGFQQLVDQYVSKGIPVMIGEFQAAGKSVLSSNPTEASWNSLSCYYWNKYVVDSALAHGMSPFYWSTGGSPLDYGTGAVNDTNAVRVLTGGVAFPPPNGAPYAVSGLIATLSNNTNVNLSWTAGSGATSYSLYRAAESGYESSIAPVATGITGTSYIDTNLNSGTTYYYQVVAVNGSGPTGYSPEAHATITGVNLDPALYNFETDPQGWAGDNTNVISGVATSPAQHYAGKQSLAVNINSVTTNSASVKIGNVSVLPGQTITFRIWIPSGHNISNLQPYLQDNNWGWSSSWYGSFTANAWNTLSLTVPANAVSPFHYLGIQFNTSAGWTNTCYLDSVSWNTPAPDFIFVANSTSLTVKGGTNGTSAITVTPTNGLNGCYTFSASNLPGGVTATFATNPITGGANTLTFTASNTVTSGTSNVTITATSGLISHITTIALTLVANTPPTLAVISNRTVNVGQTVAFTASATDTDSPPQTLTFALLASPANATLNAASGAFSFRPLVTQADSSNSFILKVSDNGVPPLSATQSFSVVVNSLSAPGFSSSISFTSGQISFSVSGQSGPDYAIESSTNLTQWSNVCITNSPAVPFIWTDTSSSNSPQRFYRIKLGPPLP